jgi:hypothetical protein
MHPRRPLQLLLQVGRQAEGDEGVLGSQGAAPGTLALRIL